MKEFRCMIFYDEEYLGTYGFGTEREFEAFKIGFELGQEYNLHTSMYELSDLEKIRDKIFDEKFKYYPEAYQKELKEAFIELQKWDKEV